VKNGYFQIFHSVFQKHSLERPPDWQSCLRCCVAGVPSANICFVANISWVMLMHFMVLLPLLLLLNLMWPMLFLLFVTWAQPLLLASPDVPIVSRAAVAPPAPVVVVQHRCCCKRPYCSNMPSATGV
jgi:hypothetical protein